MIHLQNTNLIAIPVSEDAENIRLQKDNKLFFTYKNASYIVFFQLPEGEYELLGYATSEHISFDVEPLGIIEYNSVRDLRNKSCYRIFGLWFDSANEAFYSLLQASGVYFVNPIDKPPLYAKTFAYNNNINALNHIKEYENSQKQTSPKFAILKQL